uniref:Interferon stimulated exonuclease 20 like 2 n=1 Tax=Sphenodon punctatus TaxID=8508 RepID=A0A8D0G3F1_SPHPU
MSDLILNLNMGVSQTLKRSSEGNEKHQRFVKRRRFLEKRGFLKQKQLPPQQHPPKGPVSCPGSGKDSGFWDRNKRKPSAEDRVSSVSQSRAGRDQNTFQADGPGHQPKTFPKANHHCRFTQSHTTTDTNSHGSCQTGFSSGAKKSGSGSSKPSMAQRNHSAQPPADVHSNGLPSEYESGLSPAPPLAKPSKMVAIDCEMVGTGPGGRNSDLARCSIVSYHGDVIYDKYIRPVNHITNFRTRWSGIRKHHMTGATPFKTAQKEILKILSGKIVIGHAIHNDFKALKYFHPKQATRDTSKIPLLNRKAGFPEHESASLKRLTKQLLHRDIQVGQSGHSSVEDARATMELYRIVEPEWERHLALTSEQD